MSNRWVVINTNLKKCRKIAKILKKKNPKDLPPMYKNTIVVYRKNGRYCWGNGREMGQGVVAHAHTFTFTICIRQYQLFFPWSTGTKKGKGSWSPRYNVFKSGASAVMFGNWSLIELICHELAHFMGSDNRTIHGKKWYNLFQKFMSQMANEVISGNYYRVIN